MKGIVFTEFLELVEDKFGLEMVDNIIESSDLELKCYNYSNTLVKILGYP